MSAENMAEERAAAVRSGIRVEWVTVVWMALEAAVAIGSGVLAKSVLLTAFGFDSLIELISACVLLWRLGAEARGGDAERIERVEKRATRVSAVLLILLCFYVVGTAVIDLLGRIEPDRSLPGIAITIGAALGMPLLARRKQKINDSLGSPSLRADIAESVTCAYMALTVLAGLFLNAFLGWWWAEYLAAFGLLYWLIGETREALEEARGEQ